MYAEIFIHRQGGYGEHLEQIRGATLARYILSELLDMPEKKLRPVSLLAQGSYSENRRFAAAQIRQNNCFRMLSAFASGREKAENGCRGFSVAITKPREVLINAQAAHYRDEAVAAALDDALPVGNSDSAGKRPDDIVCRIVGHFLGLLELNLARRKKHSGGGAYKREKRERGLAVACKRERHGGCSACADSYAAPVGSFLRQRHRPSSHSVTSSCAHYGMIRLASRFTHGM
ncbi:hypothetical protein [Rhodomicrobium udaipurense]|uniref:hypothetical protein n=1 Tax=Rhodomicrobium udaipurense TaxID=1202716 RepID=UPI00138E0E06|nr:hypothetical protein [Rhodomicrobium udaipurense]